MDPTDSYGSRVFISPCSLHVGVFEMQIRELHFYSLEPFILLSFVKKSSMAPQFLCNKG